MRTRFAPPEAASLVTSGPYDLLLLDARHDLAAARSLCRLLGADGLAVSILAIVTEGGMVAIGPEWGVADVVLASAGPAEVHARLRLLAARTTNSANSGVISLGDLTIEEDTYTARLRGRALELTYKEFELLKFLAQHPGRVFTREQLVTEVWGYDFFGGTRTVDVHVRRLRAKLGAEHESLIGTVRNVGYKMVPPSRAMAREESPTSITHRMSTAAGADGLPAAADRLGDWSGPADDQRCGGARAARPPWRPRTAWRRCRATSSRRSSTRTARWLLARDPPDGALVGVAVAVAGDPAEVAVHPGHRRRGLGRRAGFGGDPASAAGLGLRRPAGGAGAGPKTAPAVGTRAAAVAPRAAVGGGGGGAATAAGRVDPAVSGGRRRGDRRGQLACVRLAPGAGSHVARRPARADGRGLVRPGWPVRRRDKRRTISETSGFSAFIGRRCIPVRSARCT